jgi:hypothetical protein
MAGNALQEALYGQLKLYAHRNTYQLDLYIAETMLVGPWYRTLYPALYAEAPPFRTDERKGLRSQKVLDDFGI